MNFIKLINKHYSVRAYKSTPVDQEKLSYVLEAARLAPTASNRQPFRIAVIHTNGREDDLLSVYPKTWFVHSPLVICLCGVSADCWIRKDGKQYLDVDIAIVMDYLILAATEMGLGTCFVAAFDAVNARKVLFLPETLEPMLFTPLGYPNDLPEGKDRKNLEDLVRFETW